MKLTQRRHSDRGIAIVIVLVCVFVLSALAAIFAAYMKVETRLARNSNNEAEMQWLGRSGVELARYVLAQQLIIPNEPYDALNQKWAGGNGETNSLLADITLTDVPLGDGKFSVKITDTERKFNINLALGNDALLQQAMILIGVDAAEIPTIIASIQDWLDRDDTPRVNGAESDYYQALNPPYFAKNGPIDDLSELLFVKGVTPEIYWGPNSTNHPTQVFQSRAALHSGILPNAPSLAGLVDIFTPVSSGRINLNTASAVTLQMIPGIDANMAAAIVRMRSGPDGIDGTDDDVPLRQPGGQDLINIGMNSQAAQALGQFCDVRSSTFEVQVDVEVGPSKRRYYALLRRNSPRDVQILTFRWE
jgi:general secretion pathway protein K